MANNNREETLAQWLNSVAPSGASASRIEDLQDLAELSVYRQIVSDITGIDEVSSSSVVESLENWLDKYQGKKYVIDRSNPCSLGVATLGAAVNCDQKDKYVGKMMELESHYQATLVGLIEEFNLDVDKGEIAQLRAILKRTEGELNSLKMGSPRSVKRRSSSAGSNNESAEQIKVLATKLKDMERKLKDAQNHAEEVETELDEKTQELQHIKRTSEEKLASYEEEIRVQADELDLMRSKASQLVKAEAKLAKVMVKLEETSQLRIQLKELQDESQSNLDKKLEMEAEMKTVGTLKQQLETYKNKSVDLESQLVQVQNANKAKEEEVHQIKSKLAEASDREKFMKEQLDASKEAIAQLEAEVDMASASGSGSATMASPKAISADLAGVHESASSKLEKRELEQKILVLKKENDALQEDLKRAQAKEKEFTEAAARGESQDVVERLKQHLKEKEAECLQLVTDKEKLQNYVKQSLHATQQKYKIALKNLQSQLEEKNEMIHSFKAIREEDETNHLREQRLVMSSFYEMGLELQRRTALRNNVSGSWLGKSRKQI